MKVPKKKEWGDFKGDLDVNYAFELSGGLSIDEALPLFGKNPIERADEQNGGGLC